MEHCPHCRAALPEDGGDWCPACGAALGDEAGGWELGDEPRLPARESLDFAEPRPRRRRLSRGRRPASPRGRRPLLSRGRRLTLPRRRRLALLVLAGMVVLAGIGTGIYFGVRSTGGADGRAGDTTATGGGAQDPGLYPVMVDGSWGYMDVHGDLAVAPRFEVAQPFSEGLAAAIAADGSQRYGYIDGSGTPVIPAQFEEAWDFSEGLALTRVDDVQAFIDPTGAPVFQLPPKLSAAEGFSQGLALVEAWDGQTSTFGFIDTGGALAIQPKYEVAFSFSEDGLAAVLVDGAWGYIDTTGTLVIAPAYDVPGQFSEGLAGVGAGSPDLPAYGYIDAAGMWTIEPRFNTAGEFREGLAAVSEWKEDGSISIGFVDPRGEWAIQPRFAAATEFSEGLAAVAEVDENGVYTWGYIDKTGEWAIEPRFAVAYPVQPGGVAQVDLERIDSGGPREPWSSYLGPLDVTTGYIDRQGTVLRSWSWTFR